MHQADRLEVLQRPRELSHQRDHPPLPHAHFVGHQTREYAPERVRHEPHDEIEHACGRGRVFGPVADQIDDVGVVVRRKSRARLQLSIRMLDRLGHTLDRHLARRPVDHEYATKRATRPLVAEGDGSTRRKCPRPTRCIGGGNVLQVRHGPPYIEVIICAYMHVQTITRTEPTSRHRGCHYGTCPALSNMASLYTIFSWFHSSPTSARVSSSSK